MIPNVQHMVLAAMRNRRRLVVRYDDRPSRVIEPHLLYRSKQNVLTLLAYQVRGYHSSKRRGCFWRPFQLGKFDSVVVLKEMFEPRVSEGFHNVCELIQGLILAKVEIVEGYSFFDPRVQGPRVPTYLRSSANLFGLVDEADRVEES